MSRPWTTAPLAMSLAFALVAAVRTHADDPPPPQGIPAPPSSKMEDRIKPAPPFEIPDDPPPHEGAMIAIPYVIEAPDIIVVEVLQALPGRPVTGERLVRPDGKISLGFYGEIDVNGLTTSQVKIKLILQLQNYLNNEVLGLVEHPFVEHSGEPEGDLPMPPGRDRSPFDPPDPSEPGVKIPPELRHLFEKSQSEKPEPEKPANDSPDPRAVEPTRPAPIRRPQTTPPGGPAVTKPSTSLGPTKRRSPIFSLTSAQQEKNAFGNRPDPSAPLTAPKAKARDNPPMVPPGPVAPAEEMKQGEITFKIDPENSKHVFVDISSYNSKVYYVTGDVGRPGRLPFTGRETVLDALNYAGGLSSTADDGNIHLRRPSRGAKPARDYKIDLEAIHNGDRRANLQLFPGDRLVVGRDLVVKATNELDRLAAPFTAVLNQMFLYGSATRTLTASNPLDYAVRLRLAGRTYTIQTDEPAVSSRARRDAQMKDFVEAWSSIITRNAGKAIDEKAFREALIQKLNMPPGKPNEPEGK